MAPDLGIKFVFGLYDCLCLGLLLFDTLFATAREFPDRVKCNYNYLRLHFIAPTFVRSLTFTRGLR